jgi:hypothetical protein
MKKWLASFMLLPVLYVQHSFVKSNDNTLHENIISEEKSLLSLKEFTHDIYSRIAVSSLSLDALNYSIKGYYQLLLAGKLTNSQYLTVIDFSQSANEERMVVLETQTWNVVRTSLVAHGMKSGEEYADTFSNNEHSHQSSLGFYLTGEIYDGKHGYSLKLDGLEFSNNKARDRGVVIHAADYVNHDYIKQNGRLGRSHGCPALPREGYTDLVDKICGGSCVFIYAKQVDYLKKSTLCTAPEKWMIDCQGNLVL